MALCFSIRDKSFAPFAGLEEMVLPTSFKSWEMVHWHPAVAANRNARMTHRVMIFIVFTIFISCIFKFIICKVTQIYLKSVRKMSVFVLF